jgi:UDP-N-acetylglucosamine:LPS N-acetylglucosamine transferase
MRTIVDWIATARPSAVVVDVSVEVATLIRLLGVPVIVVAMPGQRTDPPHDWVYRLADHILACWPRELYEPTWLKPHREKVSYIGGVSRFDGRDRSTARRGGSAGKRRVAVLGGAGGSALDLSSVRGCAADLPDYEWQALGVSTGTWVQDPWPDLCAADVVVAHAGESSVADLATAEKAAIIVPAPRPFDEQEITGALLARAGLAVVQPHWPLPVEWPDLLHRARSIDGKRWRRWRTAGASQRAAAAIEGVAARYSEGIGVR